MSGSANLPLQFHRDRTERLLDARLAELLEKLKKSRPSDDPWQVRRAYEIASERHRDQLRRSGEPYMTHLLEVAHILADMRMDATTLTAAVLHDVIEDTEFPVSRIHERFGDETARLVEGVTKIGRLNMMAPEARQAENVRKMVLAMVNDVRVVLVKLADRLHNMRTLKHLPEDRRQAVARETLEIYAPLAHRLGMGKVRGELEDLSFRYVDSIGYEQVRTAVEARRKSGEKFLAGIIKILQQKLRENGVEARVESRIKRLFSIHQKLIRQRITVDQVYDLLAVRIITKSVKDCYTVLGSIHQMWRPVPGRIKDFIAMPRPNLYQSLHTTVITEDGHQFELQIRTEEMHKMAEEGIAAHWKYKDGSPVSAEDEQRLNW